METVAGQSFPTDAIREPWLEYTLPAWQQGDIARNVGTALGLPGAMSILPLLICVFLGIFVLIRSPRAVPQPGRVEPQDFVPVQ